jgi:site-specific recombinase XerD
VYSTPNRVRTTAACGAASSTGPPTPAGRADVERWLRTASDAGLPRASIAGQYGAVASIYRLTFDENLTKESSTGHTESIEIAVAQDEPVPIPSDAEMPALLRTWAVGRGRPDTFARLMFPRRREGVIFRLLRDTGVLVSELVGLTPDGIDPDRELVDVVGKGSRPRWCRSARGPRAVARPLPAEPRAAPAGQLDVASARVYLPPRPVSLMR